MASSRFESLLTGFATGALALCAVWVVLVVVATVLEVRTGRSSAALRALTPAVVRRVVSLCCGAALGSAGVLTPAMAEEPFPPDSLSGLRSPDRSAGPLVVGRRPSTYVVRTGDSLWTIAHTSWPALYRANRAVVGPDPDLILPGTVLRLPPALSRDLGHPPQTLPPHRKDAS